MIITLQKQNKPKQSFRFEDPNNPIIVGRNPQNAIGETLMYKQELVSRNHLAVRRKDDHIIIKDLGSSNGTYVGEEQARPHAWVEVCKQDKVYLADPINTMQIRLIEDQSQKQSQSNQSKSDRSDSESKSNRSRQKKNIKTFKQVCQHLKISGSTLKILKQMTAQRKSKAQRIKFLSLMGCKKAENYWDQIQLGLKNQNKYTDSSKKATEELQKQFQSGRAGFQKKGLGK